MSHQSSPIYSRRKFLATTSLLMAASTLPKRVSSAEMSLPERLYTTEDTTHGERRLCDGRSLAWWRAIPRLEIRSVVEAGPDPLAEVEEKTRANHASRPEGKSL